MTSVTQICNRALQKLGDKRITAIDQGTVAANACLACYEPLRDALLEMGIWGFAIKRLQLTSSATSPTFGKTYAYPLPADCIRILPPDETWDSTDLDWIIEDGSILTDCGTSLYLRYVSRVTDVSKFTPTFCEALSAFMAMEMCEQLTQSNQKKLKLSEEYEDWIAKARRANSVQKVNRRTAEDTWLTRRM